MHHGRAGCEAGIAGYQPIGHPLVMKMRGGAGGLPGRRSLQLKTSPPGGRLAARRRLNSLCLFSEEHRLESLCYEINKARRVLSAGPEEGQDEEKETKRLLRRYSEIADEGAPFVGAAPC